MPSPLEPAGRPTLMERMARHGVAIEVIVILALIAATIVLIALNRRQTAAIPLVGLLAANHYHRRAAAIRKRDREARNTPHYNSRPLGL